jgi:hypothetical protein
LNEERNRKYLRQVEYIRGHLWHRYSITVNQVMVASVKLSKWWLQLNLVRNQIQKLLFRKNVIECLVFRKCHSLSLNIRKQLVSVSDKQYYLVSSVCWWPVVLQKTPQYVLSPLCPCDNQHVYLIKSILALPVICMLFVNLYL